MLSALGQLPPADPDAADEVRQALGYFPTHASRTDEPGFVARPLPIGSGAIASACKRGIEEQEKGAGMRWPQEDPQTVASLRALGRSGRWTTFWQSHPQRPRPKVFPRQLGPITDARLKQAASPHFSRGRTHGLRQVGPLTRPAILLYWSAN